MGFDTDMHPKYLVSLRVKYEDCTNLRGTAQRARDCQQLIKKYLRSMWTDEASRCDLHTA